MALNLNRKDVKNNTSNHLLKKNPSFSVNSSSWILGFTGRDDCPSDDRYKLISRSTSLVVWGPKLSVKVLSDPFFSGRETS